MIVCLRTVAVPPERHDEVFDAWIATPHRDALTASEVHRPSPTGRSPVTR